MTPDPDEITTDVDPSWVAAIRSGSDQPTPASPEPTDDWTEAEPMWDPEATVGVSDGLIDRIRQELGSTAPAPPPPSSPASRAPGPTSPAPRAPAAPPAPAASPSPPSSAPPPAMAALSRSPIPPVPTSTEHEQVSTTVRWEPRQRLTAAAPVNESTVIAPTHTPGIDRTKVAIAGIAAIALVVVAWLFLGSRGDDSPPPTIDSVPASAAPSGDSTVPAPADPSDGAGG